VLAHFLHFSRHATCEQKQRKLKGLSDTCGNLVRSTCLRRVISCIQASIKFSPADSRV